MLFQGHLSYSSTNFTKSLIILTHHLYYYVISVSFKLFLSYSRSQWAYYYGYLLSMVSLGYHVRYQELGSCYYLSRRNKDILT